MKKIFQKLKERWRIESTRQLALILFIFSISGMSVFYVRELAFRWLGFNGQTPFWEEAVAWILVVVPTYQLLFLMYGTILGQFEFVWRFEKDNFRRMKKVFEKFNSLL